MFADNFNIAIFGKPKEIYLIVERLEIHLNNIMKWLVTNSIKRNLDIK